MTATQLRSERYALNKRIDRLHSNIYKLGDWVDACGQDNYDGEEAENEANFTLWNDEIDQLNARLAQIKTELKELN
jgi:predicted RNase H-like nuclease (RuvC/YqgF family)